MQTILVDCRYYDEICSVWGKEFHILPSFYHPKLAEPIAAHPDMTLFAAGKGCFFCAPEAYEYYASLLEPFAIELVAGESFLDCHYPEDIAYNVARVGEHLFGHPSADPAVFRFAQENALQFHRVKQGYAKCSSCVISENALITADVSVFRAAERAGVSALKISDGGILLPGYDCGFIGGASGRLPDGRLLFFGNVSLHPDADAIFSFCAQYGVCILDIKNKPLTDIGTILSIAE